MIAGKECLVWVLFDYLWLNDSMITDDLMWIFDVVLIVKNNDFDRVMLFVDWVLLESIDFTGDLGNWCVINRCILMCYFFIKYVFLGWVRLNAYFSRVWEDFGRLFWWFLMIWKLVECLLLLGFIELSIEVMFWVWFGWNVSETLILQGVCG